MTDLYSEKCCGRDADYRHRMTVEADRAPDDVWISAKFALPERVAHDGPGCVARWRIVLRRERASDRRFYAQSFEEAAADVQTFRVSRLAAGCEVESRRAPGENIRERLLLLPELLPLRVCEAGA